MRRSARYSRHLYNAYDLEFKRSVVIYAEKHGNKETRERFAISEANIRRWRRHKTDFFGPPVEYEGRLRTRKPVDYRADHYDKPAGRDSLERDSQSSVDSMPLQERLSKVAAQEKIAAAVAGASAAQVMKSQPLSPTKLKVTRHSPKAPPKPEIPQSPANEEMCLRWNSHHSNMQTAFPSILSKEQYVDVTLAAEGKTLKCHRLILSSCSPYFEEILNGISPFQHPVLIMRDIPFWILKSLCDFMYAGEVHIYQNKLEELLTVAEALKIKGLAGKSTPPENQDVQSNKSEKAESQKDTKKKPIPPQPEKERGSQAPPRKPNKYETLAQDYDDDMLDPLDLLEPLYEEAAEEKKGAIVKPKENKFQYQPMKKPFTRKLRKRKLSEQRDPSPPPVFSFRKGTRSRPNVKIPKYYHSDFANPSKTAPNSQTDPLLDVDEIKAEPIDVEDNNLVDYADEDGQYVNSITNCDSPVIITSAKPPPPLVQDKFKKIKLSKPLISDVHTIEEAKTTSGGLEVIKITLQKPEEAEKSEENDPLQGAAEASASGVTIASVVSLVEEDEEDANGALEITAKEKTPEPLDGVVQSEDVVDLEIEPPSAGRVVPEGVVEVEPEGVVEVEPEGVVEVGPEGVVDAETTNSRLGEEPGAGGGDDHVPQVEERPTALDHLEKEAMNVVNAINQAGGTVPDVE